MEPQKPATIAVNKAHQGVGEQTQTASNLRLRKKPRSTFAMQRRIHELKGEVAGTAGTHPTVNLQSAFVGEPQTGDNVTIEAGRSPYDMLEDQLLESH
jgi:hypothetical protein